MNSTHLKRILVGLFLLIAAAMAGDATINRSAPTPPIQQLNGQTFSWAGTKGKVVFVNFWASWCPPCRQELTQLNVLANRYKANGFIVLAINVDKEKSKMTPILKWLEPLASNFVPLFDHEQKAVAQYGAETMPSSFIIDKKGIVRYVHSGFKPEDLASWNDEVKSLFK